MIKIIVVDDEKPALDMMVMLLNKYFHDRMVIVDQCVDIFEAEQSILKFSPDIVFLDIRMKHGGGFELLRKIGKSTFDVIFTTAHSEYALEAIKQSALDYLLKPINPADLIMAMKRFDDKYANKFEIDRIRLLIENLDSGSKEYPKVAFPVNDGYKLIKSSTIKYCEADVNYTRLHLINGDKMMVSKTLKRIEELLPEQLFLRPHKSYLVNKNYIKEYKNKEGHFLVLINNEEIPVSGRKKSEVLSSIT